MSTTMTTRHNNLSLQQAVQRVVEHPELTADELQQLQSRLQASGHASANNASTRHSSTRNQRSGQQQARTANVSRLSYFAIAASVAFVVALGGSYLMSTIHWGNGNNHAEQWAALIDQADNEIARNHIQRKPLEIASTQFAALSEHFSMLNFQLIEPTALTDTGAWELVGGRYCMLLGHDAAQLILRETSTGRTQSLYQAKLTPEEATVAAGMGTTYATVDGVKMKFWVDDGVLCAMTVN